MSLDTVFSIPQFFGYLAFIFGVGCFLQKSDLRFKVFMSIECLSYVIHFWLLGNYTAMASTAVSLGRSVVSIRTRSPWAGGLFICLSLLMGALFYNGPLSLLPIMAACCGTTALYWLQGIRMRALMMVGTLLWQVNNILSGSIGGTALEAVIVVTNGFTMWRMWRDAQRQAA